MARWSADGCAEAMGAALAPYAWRRFTEGMLARRVIGAADRHSVRAFLAGLPGTAVGGMPPVEPAESGDERVDVVLRVLERRRWRESSLERLCADLLAALDAWHAERDARSSGARGLFDGR